MSDFFIEWAGEISANGQHPSSRAWRVYIQPLQRAVELSNKSIATSGDYAQKEWGNRYFHIINPISGMPMRKKIGSISAATAIAPNCAIAVAFATSLMLFDTKEDAFAWSKTITENSPELTMWTFSH